MNLLNYASIAAIVVLVVVMIIILGKRQKSARHIQNAQEEAQAILARAKEDGEKFKREAAIEAREKDLSRQAEFDAHNREKQRKINETERRLVNKEENLERRFQALERKERDFSQKENRLFQKEKDIETLEQKTTEIQGKALEELERISGLTQEEAKAQLIKRIEDEAKLEAIGTVRKIEEETREKAAALAR
jgi:ribonuclease Y